MIKIIVTITKFNKLDTKVSSLQKKYSDISTLIHRDQYNTLKQNLEKKKLEILIKNS